MVDQHQQLARQLWRALIKIADESTLDDVPTEDWVETLQLVAIKALSTAGPTGQFILNADFAAVIKKLRQDMAASPVDHVTVIDKRQLEVLAAGIVPTPYSRAER